MWNQMLFIWSDIICTKGTSPKLGLGQGFDFVFSGEKKSHQAKESEERNWENDISEEKEQIIQKKKFLMKKIHLAY